MTELYMAGRRERLLEVCDELAAIAAELAGSNPWNWTVRVCGWCEADYDGDRPDDDGHDDGCAWARSRRVTDRIQGGG